MVERIEQKKREKRRERKRREKRRESLEWELGKKGFFAVFSSALFFSLIIRVFPNDTPSREKERERERERERRERDLRV